MKASNSGVPSSNFSLKCVKTLQKCIKDLKKAIRLIQFESQRIQKHSSQQILNFSLNLLTALTTCNLYRINFQEEAYYLTQLQKIEKGINEIVEFVQQLSNKKYFTTLGNNLENEDLFIQLESTFDSFVGPLLHIFNNINVNWLLFQSEPLKLFLLDEFNQNLICQKLGIASSDEFSENGKNKKDQENSPYHTEQNVNISQNICDSLQSTQISKIDMTNVTENHLYQGFQNHGSVNIKQQDYNNSKILELKKKYIENKVTKKQFITDLISLYKQIIPQNTCLCELAILIDFMSDQNPDIYYQIFLENYIQLFDFNTSQKISYILKEINNFETLNKYTRLIFYNMDIMNLNINQILKLIKTSTNQKYKDLHIQLVRSGFNSLPIPLTTSPLTKHEKKGGFSIKNPPQLHFQFNLQRSQNSSKLIQKQENPKFSSSNFNEGQEIIICPHSSNFFSLTPILNDIFSDNKVHNIDHTKNNLQGNNDMYDIKNKNKQINCHYIQQLIDQKTIEEQSEEYMIKRSNTISERCCEYVPSPVIDDMLTSCKPKQFHDNDFMKIPKIDLEIQKSQNQQDSNTIEGKEQKINLIKKKEIVFGRRAKNYIIKPDFYFEDLEFSLSRQQFKIMYEDQSNEYNIQCMSQSSLTQLLIDEQGFELTQGAVFIIQDQIAFQVVSLKQFSELIIPGQKNQIQNSITKSIIKTNSINSPEQHIPEKSSHAAKIQQYKKRLKSGKLSYKNSQLFEEYDIQQYNEGKTIEFDDKLSFGTEENNSKDDNSDYSNTLSDVSNENSSASLESSTSISQIATNHMQQQFDKRTSIKNKKNQFINQIRQIQSQRGSYRYFSSTCQQSDFESPTLQQTTSLEQSPQPITPHSMLNKQMLKMQVVEQENSLTEPIQQSVSNDSPNLLQSNECDEVTQDFKKQTTFNLNETQIQQQSSTGIQQSVQINGMNLSSQKFMMQSNMNQSALSIAGNSFYEIEDDPYKDDAILHIRVLWSNIETDKEDYVFQYNPQTDRDSILINFGSEKQNQVRIHDKNNLIKPQTHCKIVCQDNAWTIVAENSDFNFYSGLALKKIEEIESGLVSKKILLESGYNILVQGYIFSCDV